MASGNPPGPNAFDPYYTWLGIPPEEQPPDYFRLLGVKRFEPNADAIANAADQRMAHLRTFQNGKRASFCQQLLNEVAAARKCLLDRERKAEYESRLKSLEKLTVHPSGWGLGLERDAQSPPAPPPGPMLAADWMRSSVSPDAQTSSNFPSTVSSTSVTRRLKARSSNNSLTWIMLLVCLAMLGAVGYVVATKTDLLGAKIDLPNRSDDEPSAPKRIEPEPLVAKTGSIAPNIPSTDDRPRTSTEVPGKGTATKGSPLKPSVVRPPVNPNTLEPANEDQDNKESNISTASLTSDSVQSETPMPIEGSTLEDVMSGKSNAMPIAVAELLTLFKPVEESRTKIPSEDDLAPWKKKISTQYAAELKDRSPEVTLNLIHTLLAKGSGATDSVESYSLLRSAIQFATKSRQVEWALVGTEELTRRFDVDPANEYVTTITALQKSAPESAPLLEMVATDLACERFEKRDLQGASVLSEIARKLATKQKDVTVAKHLKRFAEETASLAKMQVEAYTAAQKLEQSPSDPEANESIGLQISMLRPERRSSVLRFLARGPETPIANAARSQLAAGADDAKVIVAAKAWIEVIRSRSTFEKPALLAVAESVLTEAKRRSVGDERTELESSINELEGKKDTEHYVIPKGLAPYRVPNPTPRALLGVASIPSVGAKAPVDYGENAILNYASYASHWDQNAMKIDPKFFVVSVNMEGLIRAEREATADLVISSSRPACKLWVDGKQFLVPSGPSHIERVVLSPGLHIVRFEATGIQSGAATFGLRNPGAFASNGIRPSRFHQAARILGGASVMQVK